MAIRDRDTLTVMKMTISFNKGATLEPNFKTLTPNFIEFDISIDLFCEITISFHRDVEISVELFEGSAKLCHLYTVVYKFH